MDTCVLRRQPFCEIARRCLTASAEAAAAGDATPTKERENAMATTEPGGKAAQPGRGVSEPKGCGMAARRPTARRQPSARKRRRAARGQPWRTPPPARAAAALLVVTALAFLLAWQVRQPFVLDSAAPTTPRT